MRVVSLALAWLGGFLALGAGLLALYALVVWARLPDPADLPASGDPGPTAFMAEDDCRVHARRFVPLSEVDPRLSCAVVWAEDWQFFHHDGVDREALGDALERSWEARAPVVGGSTITMQLARNLYLTRARTPSRKGAEIALALALDDAWSKRRQLELYLNAAEWAPCVYGAEMAAHHYFGHGAARLDLAEAVFLASMLPRPSQPPPAAGPERLALVRHQQKLLKRVSRSGLVGRDEFMASQRQILDRWGGGWMEAGPVASGLAWGQALERVCGTLPFRQMSEKGAKF